MCARGTPIGQQDAIVSMMHSATVRLWSSPFLVEEAGSVARLGLSPVTGKELAQKAFPCGVARLPQVLENLRWLLFGLSGKAGTTGEA